MMIDVEKQIARAKELLSRHGFKLTIEGCGCCGSPRVKLLYEEDVIIGDTVVGDTPKDDIVDAVDSCFFAMS